jgi:hypothetical protein
MMAAPPEAGIEAVIEAVIEAGRDASSPANNCGLVPRASRVAIGAKSW